MGDTSGIPHGLGITRGDHIHHRMALEMTRRTTFWKEEDGLVFIEKTLAGYSQSGKSRKWHEQRVWISKKELARMVKELGI